MTMETRWFVTESWQEWRLGVKIGRVDHSTQPCVWLLVNTWVGYLTTISGNQISTTEDQGQQNESII